ncbi:MAG: ATP-binding cassette domain-containing protein, partial [Firmicutes bacterium]|nr:ATP-binding cassette domain-containing protein [Bacillota bacterium]
MLKISDVYFSYGKIQALRGASLELEEGRIHTVIGSNGAGKSTLMSCIMGLNKPQSGEITYNGKPLPAAPHLVVKQGIVLVPEGRQIFHNLSVEENLLIGGYTTKDRQPGVDRSYEMFPRLGERRHQRAGTLSGGEQQMLAIARGL